MLGGLITPAYSVSTSLEYRVVFGLMKNIWVAVGLSVLGDQSTGS